MENRETHWLDNLKHTLQDMKYVNHPVSEVNLMHLEGELGIRLPSDYREFLLHIGHGAGPHELWSPDRILAELGQAKEGKNRSSKTVQVFKTCECFSKRVKASRICEDSSERTM